MFHYTAGCFFTWDIQWEVEPWVLRSLPPPRCWLPVWSSASSKRWYFKTPLWHDSCVYALVLLFPTICFTFPPSFPSLCFQPELHRWLIAAIKTGSCWSGKKGCFHFPSRSHSFHSLCPSLFHHYYFFPSLHHPLLYLHLTHSQASGLVCKDGCADWSLKSRSRVKYVHRHWMDCYVIRYKHSWSPHDESL